MNKITVLPDTPIQNNGIISRQFLDMNITNFWEACRHVHHMPYGYNSNSDDIMSLFKENRGTCITKHAVIATLAEELNLPVFKHVGIYKMEEGLVTGSQNILDKYNLPYVPLAHCFLVFGKYRVDLTEGNRNGKNHSIEEFLHTEQVIPNISRKDEYFLYKNALIGKILKRSEFKYTDLKTLLQAHEEGVKLLKENVKKSEG